MHVKSLVNSFDASELINVANEINERRKRLKKYIEDYPPLPKESCIDYCRRIYNINLFELEVAYNLYKKPTKDSPVKFDELNKEYQEEVYKCLNEHTYMEMWYWENDQWRIIVTKENEKKINECAKMYKDYLPKVKELRESYTKSKADEINASFDNVLEKVKQLSKIEHYELMCKICNIKDEIAKLSSVFYRN